MVCNDSLIVQWLVWVLPKHLTRVRIPVSESFWIIKSQSLSCVLHFHCRLRNLLRLRHCLLHCSRTLLGNLRRNNWFFAWLALRLCCFFDWTLFNLLRNFGADLLSLHIERCLLLDRCTFFDQLNFFVDNHALLRLLSCYSLSAIQELVLFELGLCWNIIHRTNASRTEFECTHFRLKCLPLLGKQEVLDHGSAVVVSEKIR